MIDVHTLHLTKLRAQKFKYYVVLYLTNHAECHHFYEDYAFCNNFRNRILPL